MKHEPSQKEISKMSYESRMLRFHQEEQELFANAAGMTTEELAQKHREMVEKWKV